MDKRRYRHTIRICNTYCYSTATMVAWTRLNITFTFIACIAFSCGASTRFRVMAFPCEATQSHSLVTPTLDEWSARLSDLYLTTHSAETEFLLQNQRDALISQIYFWNRTLHLSNTPVSLTLHGTTSTSTAGLNWTPYDSHTTHHMLPQHQINITK